MSTRKCSRIRFLGRVLRYFLPDLPIILALLMVIGASTLLCLLQVWPLAILVDSVLTPGSRATALHQALAAVTSDRVSQIVILAVAGLVLRVAAEALSLLRSMLNVRISNNGLLRVRSDLFRKLQGLCLHYHRSRPQGDMIFRLTDNAAGLPGILGVLIDLLVAALTLVVMLGVMLSRNVELTLIALGIVPLLVAANLWFGEQLGSQSRAAKELESLLMCKIQRAMASISLVQAFGREASEFDHFHRTARSSHDAWSRFHWKASWYRLCVGTILGGGMGLLLGYGGYLVHRDQFVNPTAHGMTVGELMVFVSYLAMFYDPLCKLTGASASLQGGIVGVERVFEVLDQKPLVQDAPDAIDLPRQPRTLTLTRTSFAYPQGDLVLNDITLSVQPGQMVALVGPSGVGKSSLLNLLPRFYDPTAGSLQLDGHDLRRVKLRDLRRHIALVLQEALILPTTIAENIAYGSPQATADQIRQAAQAAGAAEFIEAMPAQYETPVAEGGQSLSGGQRQRIAIARALLTEAPIIVLDEPTSALDAENEQLITRTLNSLRGKRTLIVVSHRLTTVAECDQIYVMQQGRIVEHGQHHELLARRGRYYEMATRQFQFSQCPRTPHEAA